MRLVVFIGGPVSRTLHNLIFHDFDMALCARAWLLHESCGVWRLWVRCFGEAHCRASYEHHRRSWSS